MEEKSSRNSFAMTRRIGGFDVSRTRSGRDARVAEQAMPRGGCSSSSIPRGSCGGSMRSRLYRRVLDLATSGSGTVELQTFG
jgi:hypothetical protein